LKDTVESGKLPKIETNEKQELSPDNQQITIRNSFNTLRAQKAPTVECLGKKVFFSNSPPPSRRKKREFTEMRNYNIRNRSSNSLDKSAESETSKIKP
jgi:hypothetical protein